MKLVSILFLFFVGSFVWAQEKVSVEAHFDRDVVAIGEEILLNVVVTLNGDGQINEPRLSDTGGLELQGKNSSVSMQSQLKSGPQGMQFEKKKIQNFIYSFTGKKEANYTLAPIEVVVDGKAYHTKPLRLEINNKEAKKQAQRQAQSPKPRRSNPFGFQNPFGEDEADSLLGQLLQNQHQPQEPVPSRKLPVNTNEAFFVTVELDKTEVYEGEQIFANWYLYTRGELYQLDRLKFPALKGFWKEDIEAAPNLIYQNEIVNGVPFRKALLASHALFPIKPGVAVVDDYKVRAMVSLPSNNFGGFAFGKPYTYTRASETVPITVKPLPLEGRPESFSGAVGKYEISIRPDNQNIQQWQPFVVRLRYEGEGNAKLIEMPKIKLPDSLELYDATNSEAKYFKSGKSYKEFQMSIISKEGGSVTLPPIELSYFDTESGAYKIIQTEPLSLTVTPGEKPADLGGERVLLPEEEAQKNAQKFVMPGLMKEIVPVQIRWLTGWMAFSIWTAIYSLLGILFVCLYFYWGRLEDDGKDIHKWLNQRLVKIRPLMSKKEYRVLASECLNLVYKVVGSIADDGNSGLEIHKLLEQLPPSIRHDLGKNFEKQVERWQLIAFAPEIAWGEFSNPDKIQSLFSETIHNLESALRMSESSTGV